MSSDYQQIIDSIGDAAANAETNIQVLVNYCKQHQIRPGSNSAVAALKHAAAWGYELGYKEGSLDQLFQQQGPCSNEW